MATLITSYGVENFDSQFFGVGNNQTKVGQSFSNLSPAILTSCQLYLQKTGTVTGNATAFLYAITGTFGVDAIPSGSILATSNNLDVSTIGDTPNLFTFTFSDSYKMGVENYFIVIKYDNGDGSNYIQVASPALTDYPGNDAYFINPDWFADDPSRLIFYLYGDLLESSSGIHFDNITSETDNNNPITSSTFSHTVGVHNDRVLIVITYYQNNGLAAGLGSITYDDENLTFFEGTVSGGIGMNLWILVNPHIGTHDVVLTYPIAHLPSYASYLAVSYYGVKTDNILGENINEGSVVNGLSVSVNAINNNSWIVGFLGHNDTNTITVTSGVERINFTGPAGLNGKRVFADIQNINEGQSGTLSGSVAGGSPYRSIAMSLSPANPNLFLQVTTLVASDPNGDIQTINAGKSDDGTPIYYELETQEIEFSNRANLKQIADKLTVYGKNTDSTQLQAQEDDGDYKQIPLAMDKTVNIGKDINLEGNFFKFRWFGESTSESPIIEGITIENINDKGITHG